MQVRPAAVAGSFYPLLTSKLVPMIKGYVKAAEVKQGEGNSPKAVIAPHAGYIYSGPTAAFSFARLATEASLIRRIVLLGPAHRVPVKGMALPVSRASRRRRVWCRSMRGSSPGSHPSRRSR